MFKKPYHINIALVLYTHEIQSFAHISRNENGLEQFEIAFFPSLFQRLFKRPGTSYVLERSQTDGWYEKSSRAKVHTTEVVDRFLMDMTSDPFV